MDQQLTIFCSDDLIQTVTHSLNRILEEGYVHLPNAVGVIPNKTVAVGDALSFPASVFIITSGKTQIDNIVGDLQKFSNQCRVKPCLKMVVSEVSPVSMMPSE